jgi:hypothetical protein
MNIVARVSSDDGLVSVVEGALDSAFTGVVGFALRLAL